MNLKDLLSPIADDMTTVNAVLRERLSSRVALINEMGTYVVSAGGKRVRPALVLLAARALGAEGTAPHLLAAVVELIHTATLLHDDVVDHSTLRRGRKTANDVWGNAGAVLSGDFLYTRAFQMMVAADSLPAMRVMADATNAIAEGEVLQLLNAGNPEVSEAAYLRVIELKTAVLFRAASVCGALCAQASPAAQSAVAAYGHDLGMAFQLIDDVLDYAGQTAESGKAVGNDLVEGKPTLPLIHAMRAASPEQAELLRNAVRRASADALPDVLAIVAETDAISYTRALAERYCASAIDALGDLPDSPYKQCMSDLAAFAISRRG